MWIFIKHTDVNEEILNLSFIPETLLTRCCHSDSNTRTEVFAPKYEASSDIVTNKKVAQSNQKKGKGAK